MTVPLEVCMVHTQLHSQGLYAAAENLMEHVMKKPSLQTIQAILCCAMYSMRSSSGVSVW